MGKLNEAFREQQEINMYNSLESREAYIKGYEKGYEEGWQDKERMVSISCPACRNCKHRQFGAYCSFLDTRTAHDQICDKWVLREPTRFVLGKDTMKRLSMLIAGLIEEGK